MSTNRGVLVAVGTMVLANLLILGGVLRNRAGNPDAVVRLSERELQRWGNPSEGAETFLNFRLRWTMATGADGKGWFDRARLEALGVTDLPAAGDTTAHRDRPRRTRAGYVVLELAGPAWERWAAAVQRRQDSVEAARPPAAQEKHAGDRRWLESKGARATRLMAVDIGTDPSALRQQYGDRSRYVILPATYRADIIPAVRDSMGAITSAAEVRGEIDDLLPGTVHVPRPLRDSLLALGAATEDSTTHFEVTLKVGRRWEAWVE